jgi:uncharacterized membrane protein
MDTSILLAKIIGPLFLVVGTGIFINLEHYRRILADFGASPFQIYVSGMTALIFGLLVVAFHNVWAWSWPVIITILGWATLLKGVLRVVAPKLVRDRAERYARNTNVVTASAVTVFALGAVLTYFAFVPAA